MVYGAAMTKERALTELELQPGTNHGEQDWILARWKRADGSGGEVWAQLRRKSEHDWYVARLEVIKPTSTLLRDIPLARIESAANANDRVRAWVAEGVRRKAPPRHRLERPRGRRLDDRFYIEVAAAYVDAVAHGLRPAKALAEDSDTPQGTVNRWIAAARGRGYLPKTSRPQ
jgi:hypothetical protein